MLDVLLTASVSFLITFLAIPVIIRISIQKKLYDIPDARKLHTRPISSLGGVGIFAGFLLASLLAITLQTAPEFQYFFAASTVIFFLGLKDDIVVLNASKKFVGQVIAAAIIIHLGGIQITSMHGLFGIHELPPAFGLALTYITIIVVTNAYNLIDGVDGLAGTLGLLTTTVFGTYFFFAGLPAYAMIAYALGGSLLAFLIFNFNPAKIFMGDTGSLLLGLINAVLAIKFLSVADSPAGFPIESAVAICFSVLMVPLADTLRVFTIRIFHGRSPFSPDRNHIHHLLMDRGLRDKYVPLCCLVLNIVLIGIAYLTRGMGPTISMMTIISFAAVLLLGLVMLKKPLSRQVALPHHASIEPSVAPLTKVVSITTEAAVAEN
jgi:UDP-GlcNAc:undecaprenyl-phosphate/decaprenyl-phosphate GlcNAc-1-phosphate transferase